MVIERERLSSGFLPKWIVNEHQARFEFAAHYVKDKIVVDCACGTGVGSKIFALAGAKQVLAYDLSADEVFAAQGKNRLPNLVYAVADATHLPCPNESVDVYISLETVEHLADDTKFLAEVKRVLKPGGIFICSTPNRTVTNPLAKLSDKPWNKFHLREYSRGEFCDLLKKYFGTVEISGQNPKSVGKIKLLNFVAKLFSTGTAVRFSQILKLPLLFFDNIKNHQVQPVGAGKEREYLVAVCR